ncbi:COX15/CtaA family protein [Opitutales bacterium]|nr:COX15/CtaA family protein [Opitutales bacterium]
MTVKPSVESHVKPSSTFDGRVWWLRGVCLSVMIILVVGGITRLTGSGLSMVDWRPVSGILPPIGEAAWAMEFAQYKESPQYKLVNQGMSLGEFQYIFFWEYLHRVLGRVVGLVCLIPYLWFLLRGKLDRGLKLRGGLLVFLVGAQGFMGWYMVKSGLVKDPEVSHFRLAAHLSLAFAIFGLAWWASLRLSHRAETGRVTPPPCYRNWAVVLLAVLCLQIIYGAFTSGMKAGYGFNTYPLMGGELMPQALFSATPYWTNFVSDKFTVQFIHRWLGTCLALGTLFFCWYTIKSEKINLYVSQWTKRLSGLVVIQFLLGVCTLLWIKDYPVILPSIHQFMALLLFASLLALIHQYGETRIKE